MFTETQIQTLNPSLNTNIAPNKTPRSPFLLMGGFFVALLLLISLFVLYNSYGKGKVIEKVSSAYNLGLRVPEGMELFNFPADSEKLSNQQDKLLACAGESGETLQCVVDLHQYTNFSEHKLTALSYRRLPFATEDACKTYLSVDGETPLSESIQMDDQTIYHGASQWRNQNYLIRDLAHHTFVRGLCVEILARSLFDPATNLNGVQESQKYKTLFDRLGQVQFNLNAIK